MSQLCTPLLVFSALILASCTVAADTKLHGSARETNGQSGACNRNVFEAIDSAAVVAAEVGMGRVQRRIRCCDAVTKNPQRIDSTMGQPRTLHPVKYAVERDPVKARIGQGCFHVVMA